MSRLKNYYEILNVDRTSSQEQIKAAFRKLAQIHHPDKNSGSSRSGLIFRSIHEAYSILSREEKRKQYDNYLENSRIQPVQSGPASGATDDESAVETLCSRLNFIFWEIEDIFTPGKNKADLDIRKYSGASIRRWLLTILIFIDRWVLTPAGYGDYFFQARLIDNRQSYETLTKSFNPFHHNPYMSFNGYFYKIRLRLDKFINGIRLSDLQEKLPGSELTLMDCIYESLNMSYHYLGAIHMILSGKSETVPHFTHKPGFSDRESPILLS
ncbi:J domain-containing protein [Spirochaeta isovalerica]|uniref:Curved DNA-binding protein CbpA n=1 Tax=Spirochaeta isovalerica TaxID=150 RepID=A0A841RFW2_9SPIO|nr:DnaJ domain-containing protein [Spirochaeta isovalerica]MBB6481890.1 curved DNA-binding protein CbpA [Spirochaeta isovalerica]